MPEVLTLTVGGTLSVGGTGETSCRFGAQVDHVLELDVVTRRGDLLTCSSSSNAELFHMVLAGLGQCGGEITKDSDGRWRMALVTATFSDEPSVPYWDCLDRRTASVAATKAKDIPNPSLALVLPERTVRSFLSTVLSYSEAAAGIWRIEVLPMLTVHYKQPLHVLPDGALVFTVRLQRRASAEHAPDHKAMVRVNQVLAHRCIAAGGKIYPPYAPVLARGEWERHFGLGRGSDSGCEKTI